jgi:hypothetical protein
MHRDDMPRFRDDSDKQLGRHYSSETRRQEIIFHVEQYLAGGGVIREIPSTTMARPVYGFNFGDRAGKK